MAVSLWLGYLNYTDRQTTAASRENDLKYRYIRMKGATTESELHKLDSLLSDPTDREAVQTAVERYEQLVREQADKAARAIRHSMDADSLQRQAEAIKKR